MADLTASPDDNIKVATEQATPTQYQNESILKYNLQDISVPANDIYIIRLDYLEKFNNTSIINVVYDYNVNTGENYTAVFPQTVTLEDTYCEIAVNNLNSNAKTVNNMNINLFIAHKE